MFEVVEHLAVRLDVSEVEVSQLIRPTLEVLLADLSRKVRQDNQGYFNDGTYYYIDLFVRP